MDSLSRAELNAYAETLGIENPGAFKNKDELQAAVSARLEERAAAQATPTPIDPAGTAPDSAQDAPDTAQGSPAPDDADTPGSGESHDAEGSDDDDGDDDGDEPEVEELPVELEDGYIRVRGRSKERFVSFSERHEDHPGGQAWIVGPAKAVVFETPAVTRALQRRQIERVP